MNAKSLNLLAGRSMGRGSIDLSKLAQRVLSTLAPREEMVLRMRFGIGHKAPHTLDEVAQQFALTQEWIRQIETRALRKVRQRTRLHYRENLSERG
jgi:RNA polymerase primary sigma factor